MWVPYKWEPQEDSVLCETGPVGNHVAGGALRGTAEVLLTAGLLFIPHE